MENSSRRDDLLGVIATAVLLIGTATGSAKAMVILSVTVLVLLFGRAQAKRGALLVAGVAAVVSAGLPSSWGCADRFRRPHMVRQHLERDLLSLRGFPLAVA